MDFVSDVLFDGHRFRLLTVVDSFSRGCLAIVVGQGLRGEDIVAILERPKQERGMPRNGPEFISVVLAKWAYDQGVTIVFSRSGKSTDNPFNGSFCDECFNTHWFLSVDDARRKIESWKCDYNHFRQHSSIDNAALAQFSEAFWASQNTPLFLP